MLPIQPFEYSMKNKLDPMQHTIIKYTTRFREKGGKQDLLKAIHVLELLIEHEYGKDEEEPNRGHGGVSLQTNASSAIATSEAELARLLKGRS